MFKDELSRQVIGVSPMRLQEETNATYSDISEGDIVVVTVMEYIPPYVKVRLGNLNGIVYIEDFDIVSKTNNLDKIRKSIIANIGGKIKARVVTKKENTLILERASIVQDTKVILHEKLGTVIDATVENISQTLGLFVDIGNGVKSLIPYCDISKSRIYDINSLFKVGDVLKVRLEDYQCETEHFIISRKTVYPVLKEEELPVNSAIQVTVHSMVNGLKDGVYVEYTPAVTGIMDIPDFCEPADFKYGRRAVAIVGAHRENGLKLIFSRFIE